MWLVISNPLIKNFCRFYGESLIRLMGSSFYCFWSGGRAVNSPSWYIHFVQEAACSKLAIANQTSEKIPLPEFFRGSPLLLFFFGFVLWRWPISQKPFFVPKGAVVSSFLPRRINSCIFCFTNCFFFSNLFRSFPKAVSV